MWICVPAPQIHMYKGVLSVQLCSESAEYIGFFSISLTTTFGLISQHVLIQKHYFVVKLDYLLYSLTEICQNNALLSS